MAGWTLALAAALGGPGDAAIDPPAKASGSADASSPFTDFRDQAPGRQHHIRIGDLPAPFASASAGKPPSIVQRPPGALPLVPPGFSVALYADHLYEPRVIRTAPNGDIFVAESRPGRIRVFQGMTAMGTPTRSEVFAQHLRLPYGIAFYPPGPQPQWLYVGTTDAVLRFAYRNGQLQALGPPERLADLPYGGSHWTRDLRFSQDGHTLFVAVGSASNIDDPDDSPDEANRAAILAFDPDGSHPRIYASGMRNPAGLAVDPESGQLWCSVNERDGLGDNLVPDYVTAVREGGFYGWPWWYLGAHRDPRRLERHPERRGSVIVPDVLIQPHDASLQIEFYEASRFPAAYHGDIFATEHGSWNRSVRTGYELIRIPRHQGAGSDGSYEDFLTGFVLPDGSVWGRPVGVTTAPDGSLLVSDDASGSIWRIDHAGR